MPPKPKFTKEQVLEEALVIVRMRGERALTARNLGEAMGSSTRPLFTLWDSMDDLKRELRDGRAMKVFDDYFDGFGEYVPAFKGFGLMLVRFAAEEPNLFSFLFINEHGITQSLDEWTKSRIGDEAQRVLKRDYDVDDETARVLFTECWLHAFSICVLKVTGVANLSDREVSDSLSRNFLGLLTMAKSGRLCQSGINPVKGHMPSGMSVGDVPLAQLR